MNFARRLNELEQTIRGGSQRELYARQIHAVMKAMWNNRPAWLSMLRYSKSLEAHGPDDPRTRAAASEARDHLRRLDADRSIYR